MDLNVSLIKNDWYRSKFIHGLKFVLVIANGYNFQAPLKLYTLIHIKLTLSKLCIFSNLIGNSTFYN